MDFGDLLLNTFLLFKNNISILEKYQNRFQYILIDEYQDTNIIQFEILKALSWKSRKICGVGDDYQSIYSFRGADIKNIDNFKINFPDVKIFKLCQNYRSPSNIIEIANLLIKNNKNQIHKDLFSKINEIDGKVKILINETCINESKNIAEIINTLIDKKKCEYKDIAILYRMNIQSYTFQKIFLQKNIPHKLHNRTDFYETKIIKIIFAYLQFIINPNMDYYLKRIINNPPRNINKYAQNKLFSIAKAKKVSAWEIINNCDNELKIKEYNLDKNLQVRLFCFKNLIISLKRLISNKRVYGIVYELIQYLELKKYLKNDLSSIEKINMYLDIVSNMEDDYIRNNGLQNIH